MDPRSYQLTRHLIVSCLQPRCHPRWSPTKMITLQIIVCSSQRETFTWDRWAINKAAVHFLVPCILYIYWENKHLFIKEPVQGVTFKQRKHQDSLSVLLKQILPQVYEAQMWFIPPRYILWCGSLKNHNPCSPLVTPICYSLYCRFLSNRPFLFPYEIRHSLCFPDSSPFFIIWGQLYSPNAYFQGNKPLWKKASNVGKWPKYYRLHELCIKPRLGLAVCAIIDLRVQLGGQRLCIHHKQSTHRLHKETINKWLWKCFVNHWFICYCFVKNILWAEYIWTQIH